MADGTSTIETLARELADLRRRVDLTVSKLARQTGQFEFISGQLRDVQLYLHARFSDVEAKLDRIDNRLDGIEVKVDALPRVLAEMIAKK